MSEPIESTTNGGGATGGRGRRRAPSVAIIGAGMSGICMAAKLRQAGIEAFTLYEKAPRTGGTWRDNTYPGLVCDVPSRYYSYTFAPNPDWSRIYPPGPEIWDYLDGVTDQVGIRDRIRFESEVEDARWVDGRWRLRTKAGDEAEYDFIVSAAGVLVQPKVPEIPGLESFAGAAFHSARWDHSVSLQGRRVAVVGSGSTGVQIVRALGPVAGKLEHFNRTPQWVFPLPNKRYTRLTKWLYRRFPALSRVGYRFWQEAFEKTFATAVVQPGPMRWLIDKGCRLHLRRVRDPELRRRLTPKDLPMCKRMVMATKYYPQFERETVVLIDQAIDHVEPRGIVTADGRLHELDVIVLATGFHAHEFLRPVELVGPDGTRLSEAWEDEPRAHRTVALPAFPNFFMLMGPHSPFGNQSLITIAETQAEFIMRWIELWGDGRVDSTMPRPEATERFNDDMNAALPSTIWVSGCDSWYIGKDGLPMNFPWTPQRHREMLAAPRLEEWDVEPGPVADVV